MLSVLPMGGVHAGAAEATVNQVGPRLAKNEALRRALFVGQRDRLVLAFAIDASDVLSCC